MAIYFDNAATTRASDKVIDIVVKTMRDDFGNPSSKHIKGVEAERYVRESAQIIASTLKVKDKEIIFTSGGTESNNMALIGGALANQRSGKHIISTGIEHASVYQPLGFLETLGFTVDIVPVDTDGHVRTDILETMIRDDTVIVSIMAVNNEIGAVEPIEQIAKIIKKKNKNTLFHVDAIQGYGKVPLYPKRMGIDMLNVSGHKIHSPKGVGFLFVDESVKIKPIILGGGQQKGMRSGTINVPGIAGLGVAAKEVFEHFDERIAHLNEVKDYIIDNISLIDGVKINSLRGDAGAPHVVSVSVSGVRAEVLLHALEDKGIYVSSGSACSSHHPGISGTLKGIGLADNMLDSTIRVSLAEDNTIDEAQVFVETMKELIPELRRFTRK